MTSSCTWQHGCSLNPWTRRPLFLCCNQNTTTSNTSDVSSISWVIYTICKPRDTCTPAVWCVSVSNSKKKCDTSASISRRSRLIAIIACTKHLSSRSQLNTGTRCLEQQAVHRSSQRDSLSLRAAQISAGPGALFLAKSDSVVQSYEDVTFCLYEHIHTFVMQPYHRASWQLETNNRSDTININSTPRSATKQQQQWVAHKHVIRCRLGMAVPVFFGWNWKDTASGDVR